LLFGRGTSIAIEQVQKSTIRSETDNFSLSYNGVDCLSLISAIVPKFS
jgi:hypothetical protein